MIHSLRSPEYQCAPCVLRQLAWFAAVSWVFYLSAGVFPGVNAADAERGERLFQQQCATCHGDHGQGVEDHYPEPLVGDYTRDYLQEIVEKTMPEDDPDACVGQDAADVAAYIYDNFYSPSSRLSRQSARVELARMTVPQYRNTIADLMLSVRSAQPSHIEGNGLQATYYKSRKLNSEEELLQRIDPAINFNFEEGTPEPADGFKPEEFAIRWQGGLKVDHTGRYRIHLHSENGAKVWLNDLDTPFIDAAVRSGEATHETVETFLLGGRVYPLMVEFFKNNDPRASISLRWEPPQGVEEVIPNHHLVRGNFAEQFVVTAEFPPDDRSLGYERGGSAARSWADATTDGAVETANIVIADLSNYASLHENDSPAQRQEKLRDFCKRFVELAFGYPLSVEQQQFYLDSYFEQEEDLETAVKQILILTLKSPRFLYPGLGVDLAGSDQFAIASRLAYTLWDCPPDRQLLDAAAAGELATEQQIAEHARRMLQDLRASAKLQSFFRYWLDLDGDHDLTKDEQQFAGFDAALIADLERSLERFVEQVVWSDESDFRRLLLEDSLLLNDRLADFYGAPAASENEFAEVEFSEVKLEEMPRAGVLTHPYLLAALAHRHTTSPIHRGVFVLRRILGRSLRSPPDAIDLLDESLHPDLSTRQRIELQTRPDSCQTCHALINPLGFALENYDAVGRFRDSENLQPVNTAGEYLAFDGETLKFNNARQLAELLAVRPEVHRAFVDEIFVFLTKQPLAAFGPLASDSLLQHFQHSGFHIRDLVINTAALAALGPAAYEAVRDSNTSR